ncbi:MAG TPA: PEP-CTERM sorting domain-containing protein [Bryobacteraceae bacterium]|jgi:hypothetical protein
MRPNRVGPQPGAIGSHASGIQVLYAQKMKRLFYSILSTVLLITCANAGVLLTTGTISELDIANHPGQWTFVVSGANFSASGVSVPGVLLSDASINGTTSTYTYDFSQSFTKTLSIHSFPFSITYNGVTYSTFDGSSTSGLPYNIQLMMSFSGNVATGIANPLCNAQGCGLGTGSSPFTVLSGSFLVTDMAGDTIATDTLSGAGTGNFSESVDTQTGGTATAAYVFSDTPEPASMGLVASGLLLTGLRARRRSSRMNYKTTNASLHVKA